MTIDMEALNKMTDKIVRDNIVSHYKTPIAQLGHDIEGYVLDEINGKIVKPPDCVLSQRGVEAALGFSGRGIKRSLKRIGSGGADISENLVKSIENPIIFKYISSSPRGAVNIPNLYWDTVEGQRIDEILDKYLEEYARKWSKTFPDKFWVLLIKVKGLPSYMAVKRPQYVGHWVNDIIYDRLAPRITEELRKRNPRIDGNRHYKHHQFLTEDNGVPELREHIIRVMSWMSVARNERDFKRMLDKGAPKFGETGILIDEEEK